MLDKPWCYNGKHHTINFIMFVIPVLLLLRTGVMAIRLLICHLRAELQISTFPMASVIGTEQAYIT